MSDKDRDKLKNRLNFQLSIFFSAALLALAGLIFVILYSKLPDNFTETLTAEKLFELRIHSLAARIEAIKTLAILFGGSAILLNIYYGAERAELFEKNTLAAIQSVEVSEAGKVSDRFTKAIEELGSDNLAIRLGGIYALEQMANKNEREHWTIVQILTAFVREKASKKIVELPNSEELRSEEDKEPGSKLAIDIQAALTVIGRRDAKNEQEDQIVDLRNTNIAGADIRKANLQRAILTESNLIGTILFGANLVGAILFKANLQEAILFGAQLREAILTESNLQEVVLTEANLQGAILWKANLQGANLREANLQGAILFGANLQNANLTEANLQGAILTEADLKGAILDKTEGLEQEQIASAFGDSATVLPDYLEIPENWQQFQ